MGLISSESWIADSSVESCGGLFESVSAFPVVPFATGTGLFPLENAPWLAKEINKTSQITKITILKMVSLRLLWGRLNEWRILCLSESPETSPEWLDSRLFRSRGCNVVKDHKPMVGNSILFAIQDVGVRVRTESNKEG
ncbi:hypothetical protein OGAPHI_002751 [Ogataea philodendri]|uniref:Uncharacterized protein n=1 Tax=Ogataea philodendri TaxID=1378263 RepID=A0A9P8PBZ6_9ASCO|nr:uncharacterized protein OGAPHI_002751 [Ogataea philodendri]KAH3668996.1 hypothetical protein OGAPHI_002751 [Ogataea philodendri]